MTTDDKPTQVPCLWCGNEVVPLNPPRKGVTKLYCSFRCKRNASVAKFKEKFPERVKATAKRVRKGRSKEQQAAYFQANKDKIMAQRQAKENTRAAKDQRRYYSAKHRVKEMGLPFTVPLDVWMAMTDGTTCFYCDRPATEVDKIIPAKGYVCGNIAPCCRKCNTQKSDLSLSDFRRFTETLTAMGVA